MILPGRNLSTIISVILAFSTSSAARYDTETTATYSRLERVAAAQEQRKQRDLANDIDSYDGLYDAQDMQYRLADYPRKGDRKPCAAGKDKSCAPTTSPSVTPSTFPTISGAPSGFPTLSPSQLPSHSPSDRPSVSPSVSLIPSTEPSATPTSRPSNPPSDFPTAVPSSQPSTVPTISPMPTESVYVTDRLSAGSLVAKCVQPPPTDSGFIQEQRLAFQYNLYTVLEAIVSEEVAIMEASIHDEMSKAYLTCIYQPDESPFYISSIIAEPEDYLSDNVCDTSNDPMPPRENKCVVVNAELSVTVYFPSSRRRVLQTGTTNASTEVLTSTGEFLDTAMKNGNFTADKIVLVTFQGFVNAEEGRDTTSSPGGGSSGEIAAAEAAAATGNNMSVSNITDNKMALGGAVVGFAAMLLVLFVFMSAGYKKRKQKAYLEQLDDDIAVSDLSHEDRKSREVLGDDGRVNLVLDQSDDTLIDSSGDDATLDFILQDLRGVSAGSSYYHDAHNCSASSCPVCTGKREQHPTFISTLPRSKFSQRSLPEIQDSYKTPDTVDL